MTDVDPYDPDDDVRTELMVTAAIAEALAHPPDPTRRPTAAEVESVLDGILGITLRFYALRVLQTFISRWRTGPLMDVHYHVAQEVSGAAVAQAIDETGESVRDLVRAAADRAEGPVVVESGLHREEEAYRRLTVGMSSVGRLTVTRTRENAKFRFASEMGAVGKAWRTRRDGRVRTTHGDLEGDFVLLDEYFTTVAGNKIQRPGDPQAPLSETINCRCRLSYRMAS